MSLKEYNAKRDFKDTPEPEGKKAASRGALRFVVQMHEATRLHYDLRLEFDGSYKSWAVPKGPSTNSADQRLAVFVEDHPLDYGSFEGIIPKGNYGAGTVMVWDHGTYLERGSQGREDSEVAMLKGLAAGHLTFVVEGQKLRGEFALIRLKKGDPKSWLLVKKHDAFANRADVTQQNLSVKTGRSIKEIAADAPAAGDIWVSRRVSGPNPETFKPKTKPAKLHPLTPEGEATTDPVREKLPRRLKPLLPANEAQVFDQEGWIFERSGDGLRAIAELEKGRVHLYSRQLLSFDAKYPVLLAALRPAGLHAVLDGEIVDGPEGPVYFVFDLLHLEGMNLRELPLVERKRRLKELPIFGPRVQYRDHVATAGSQAYAEAQDGGAPALLAKDARSVYRSGTKRTWLKIKVREKAKAPAEDGGQSAVVHDPAPAVGPVALTNLDKVFWPDEGRTKGDVVDYYRRVARWILPHLLGRPQSLNRHPHGIEGQSFYQKDVTGHLPRYVHTENVYSESAEKTVTYLVCQNEETLLYLANLGCIELNPWISRITSPENPDYVIIDLDPDDSNSFDEVVRVARAVHKILNAVGAVSYLKTSGATGLHICVPVAGAGYTYEQTRAFAERVCAAVHEQFKELTSLERSPAKRRGRIYLDYMQNRRGQTLAAPYCIRPRPGAPVSTPLEWSELRAGLNPRDFNIETIFARLEEKGDLWKPMLTSSVDLETCGRELGRG